MMPVGMLATSAHMNGNTTPAIRSSVSHVTQKMRFCTAPLYQFDGVAGLLVSTICSSSAIFTRP